MATNSEPRIISSDRLHNAIIVAFEDGRTALYSAALLYEAFAQAEDLTDLPAKDDAG
jgi:hypothetical protein